MFQVMVQWLDEGQSRARFSLPGREEWQVEHIDALMQVLGDIRQRMTPAVPEEPPQLNETHFLHAPRYRTVLHEFSGGTLMQFRHPSLGWLPFLLPSLERRRISDYFHSQEVEWEHRHPPTGGSP
ncbi:MAG: hypothetical protein ACJ8G4_06270 [Burkholderiales bacterium]